MILLYRATIGLTGGAIAGIIIALIIVAAIIVLVGLLLVALLYKSKRKVTRSTTTATDVANPVVLQAVHNAAYGVVNVSTAMTDNIAYSALTAPVYDTVSANKQYQNIDDYNH